MLTIGIRWISVVYLTKTTQMEVFRDIGRICKAGILQYLLYCDKLSIKSASGSRPEYRSLLFHIIIK